jgi:hypothetical protein
VQRSIILVGMIINIIIITMIVSHALSTGA